MLIAAAHKKLKRRLDLHEDEITSCIFGSMQYLPIDIVWGTIKHLLSVAGIEKDKLLIESPDKAEFEFWPQWPTRIRYVEPDLVIHFKKKEQSILHVILEVKWGAGLNPPCELIRQWNHRKREDAQWVHLYLVKNYSEGVRGIRKTLSVDENFCEDCSRCKDREMIMPTKGHEINANGTGQKNILGCVGWRHFVAAVHDTIAAIKDTPQSISSWRDGVSRFFSKQGIITFTGFGWLREAELGEIPHEEVNLFSLTPWWTFGDNIAIDGHETEIIFFNHRIFQGEN